MRKIFDAADQYCKESNWKTIAVLKVCVLSLGIMIGMTISEQRKKRVFPVVSGVYSGTLQFLVRKYIEILFRK